MSDNDALDTFDKYKRQLQGPSFGWSSLKVGLKFFNLKYISSFCEKNKV